MNTFWIAKVSEFNFRTSFFIKHLTKIKWPTKNSQYHFKKKKKIKREKILYRKILNDLPAGYKNLHQIVVYWPLTESSIKRCTSVNKRKKKRKKVDVMKEYRQVLTAVELVGDRKARVRDSLQTEGCGPQRPPVEQPQTRCEGMLLWSGERVGLI